MLGDNWYGDLAGGAEMYNLKIEASQRGPYAQKVYTFSHLCVMPKLLTLRHLDSEVDLLPEMSTRVSWSSLVD